MVRQAQRSGIQGGPSPTAIAAAVGRAIHRRDARPKVFDDTMALDLAGDEGTSQLQKLLDDVPEQSLAGYGLAFALRARVVEDAVAGAVKDGVGQYVILGAGLDSFAYRRLDLLEHLRVFEVDNPATQTWKRRRLTDLGIEMPYGLVFAPVDLEMQTLDRGLSAAGFDFGLPAIYSWIAVTQYLTREAVLGTLGAIALGAGGTRVVFSYLIPRRLVTDELEARGFDWTASRTAEAGEPFLSFFEPGEIEAILGDLGFAAVVHFSPYGEGRPSYLKAYGDTRMVGFERLVTAIT